MFSYTVKFGTDPANFADMAEWAICARYGIKRAKHDNTAYDKNSDVNAKEKHISVKSRKFSLMAGSLCKGLNSFDAIWNHYEATTHSNSWVYVDQSHRAYEMTLEEFKQFVYLFCYLDKESKKNGGGYKIRCRDETKKMIAWLQSG